MKDAYTAVGVYTPLGVAKVHERCIAATAGMFTTSGRPALSPGDDVVKSAPNTRRWRL